MKGDRVALDIISSQNCHHDERQAVTILALQQGTQSPEQEKGLTAA
jgi:hypothetical protein